LTYNVSFPSDPVTPTKYILLVPGLNNATYEAVITEHETLVEIIFDPVK
jgi:hypothetical protein